MFHVRTIHAEDCRVDTAAYDLEPALPQGRVVCNLFAEFLSTRPMEFREPLTFLNKNPLELEWAAAAGGAAFAAFLENGTALAITVLLSGKDAEADRQMLDGLRQVVAGPMLGEETERCLEAAERPLMLVLVMPGSPERIPTLELLATALGSVYFRAIAQLGGTV